MASTEPKENDTDTERNENLISVCKQIGYPNCSFKFNHGNVQAGVDHFLSEHGWILSKTVDLELELQDFPTTKNSIETKMWTPVVINVKDKQGFVALIPVIKEEQLKLISLWLPSIPNSEHFEVPILVKSTICDVINENIQLCYSQEPKTLNNLGNIFWNFHPMLLSWINKNYTKERSLFIEVNIQDEYGNDLDADGEEEKIICKLNCNFTQKVFEFVKGSDLKIESREYLDKLQAKLKIKDEEFVKNTGECWELIIKEIFKEEIAVNLEQIKKWLLIQIARVGSPETFKYLISKGVSTNIVAVVNEEATEEEYDKENEIFLTLAHLAITDQDRNRGLEKLKIVSEHDEALLFYHYEQNKMVRGVNLLHIAASECNDAAIKYLLEMGLPVNSLSGTGMTPLDFLTASKEQKIKEDVGKTEKVLLEHGAVCNLLKNDEE